MTGCGIMSSVWGMKLLCGSTVKVSIELPVATRHCRDMTEKWLKVTLNQNKQKNKQTETFLLKHALLILKCQTSDHE